MITRQSVPDATRILGQTYGYCQLVQSYNNMQVGQLQHTRSLITISYNWKYLTNRPGSRYFKFVSVFFYCFILKCLHLDGPDRRHVQVQGCSRIIPALVKTDDQASLTELPIYHSTERNVMWSLELLLQVLACVPDPCLPPNLPNAIL